ncbi:PREDICTED: glucan endo-1,3-beta-glucosidase 4-like [Tarenaya hassleriana]|uniref:glucan endo-1,3-beta-glucosidase 4-like n=1 Tax=Tarenaya hassleriana TaxID=28532 RepID=UPI00053CA0B9|nr:PREDICTED: glucan endo-1,3-beta-glucosidase 4-like [Tarenaya hassleriana]XP_010542462.1 PREDICTED: glucan endo-1,3-beta-glucosidase 4-like [Tarenaya hassleriana]
MLPQRWFPDMILLLISILACTNGAFVGVNIGTDITNMPSPSDAVVLLKSHQITHIRLFDANSHMLKALAGSGIEVTVSVTNDELLGIGRYPSSAASWVNKNVASYVPSTNITAIAVGSEVLTTIPHVAPALVSALNNIHKALVAANLNFRVKVSSPMSMDIIPKPFPPSTATFNASWNATFYQLLRFLKNTGSYFMLNAYPYYGYTTGNGIFPLEYALFKPLSPVKQIVDPNTLLRYNSMFDAMVDAAYYSMEAMNFSKIPVVVTETGWPWLGGGNEPAATAENAETFNNNLIKRVLNNSGPPSQPDIPINTYIYELYNEDKRPGPVSERNWGMFYPNGSMVYRLSLGGSDQAESLNGSVVFCVAKDDADPEKLQDGLNWACGRGQANCSAIQPGRPCYLPDNLKSHASFAYNDYYQKMKNAGGSCDFDGTATTTTRDPSYGTCRFTGSANANATGGNFPPAAFGPVSPIGGNANALVESDRYLQFWAPSLVIVIVILLENNGFLLVTW